MNVVSRTIGGSKIQLIMRTSSLSSLFAMKTGLLPAFSQQSDLFSTTSVDTKKRNVFHIPHRSFCVMNKKVLETTTTQRHTIDNTTGHSMFVKRCMLVSGSIVFGTVAFNALALSLVGMEALSIRDLAWSVVFVGQMSPIATAGVLLAHRDIFHAHEYDKETNRTFNFSYAEDSDSRKLFFGAAAIGTGAATLFNFMETLLSSGLFAFTTPLSIFGGAMLYTQLVPMSKFDIWGPTITGGLTGMTVIGTYTGISLLTGQMDISDPLIPVQIAQLGLWSSSLFAVNACAKYSYESKLPDHLICALPIPFSYMLFFW